MRSAAAAGLIGILAGAASAHPAIRAFNAVCFKAGQTAAEARARMERVAGAPLPFDLTFWDVTLEPAPEALPGIERRCKVAFSGAHSTAAIAALRRQMATPPVFGFEVPLPSTHSPTTATALIEARELLRGRLALVHVGSENGHTFMAVDRLPEGQQ